MTTRQPPRRDASLDSQPPRLPASGFVGAHTNVPRLALSIEEACEALGVSWATWHEHIAPEVRIVRRGRRKLVAVTELQRWLDESAERVL
jgi:hypothetical protein